MKATLLATLIFFLFLSTPIKTTYPIVLMHGISCGHENMALVVDWIHEYLGEDVYVKNMEIGDGYWDSIFNSMFESVSEFANNIQSDPILSSAEKINIIAHSQGGLITRGYIELFNDPPVSTYITWSSPHAGVFGIPLLNIEWVDKLLQETPYIALAQKEVNPAQYWKDPLKYQDYLENCVYLPLLNNELTKKNPDYRKNIISLDQFVMVKSLIDNTIVPRESTWFGFYDENMNVISYNTTVAYKEDWIGIRTLAESNRLFHRTTMCQHKDYPLKKCLDNFLTNTLPFLK
ncbi:lysosomal thioesterase ppt2 [Anaeramoeba flamelloides]|uniref:Lysosomal thioesterase ppt2 n=1 Tax=Anaeramoeba flamelloides TaxID=1746091 RepID=A0ABQ8XCE8_9EUKA|nr:lysosomal thioesterase ppt2 [Anaeramoeba flamelloides]